MAKHVLDLYELFNKVVEKGGLVEVINKKQWQEIIREMRLPSSITSAAFTLRTQYTRYLVRQTSVFKQCHFSLLMSSWGGRISLLNTNPCVYVTMLSVSVRVQDKEPQQALWSQRHCWKSEEGREERLRGARHVPLLPLPLPPAPAARAARPPETKDEGGVPAVSPHVTARLQSSGRDQADSHEDDGPVPAPLPPLPLPFRGLLQQGGGGGAGAAAGQEGVGQEQQRRAAGTEQRRGGAKQTVGVHWS